MIGRFTARLSRWWRRNRPLATLSVPQAAALLGYASTTSLRNMIRAGELEVLRTDDGLRIAERVLRSTPIAMIGRAAALAGCSTKTVLRYCEAGVVAPAYLEGNSRRRFTLDDVDTIRAERLKRKAASLAALRKINRAPAAQRDRP